MRSIKCRKCTLYISTRLFITESVSVIVKLFYFFFFLTVQVFGTLSNLYSNVRKMRADDDVWREVKRGMVEQRKLSIIQSAVALWLPPDLVLN